MSRSLSVGIDGVVFQWSSRGGILRTYHEVLARISEQAPGCRFKVYLDGPLGSQPPTGDGIEVKRCLPLRSLLRPRRLLYRMEPKVRSFTYKAFGADRENDLWHATYFNLPWKPRVPVVVSNYDMAYWTCRNEFSRPYDEVFRRQQRQAVLAADLVLTNSTSTSDDTARLLSIPRERLRTVPLACSPVFMELGDGAPSPRRADVCRLVAEGLPFMLYVGARGPHKNFAALTAAYARWSPRELPLVLVGPALSPDEARALARLGIGDRTVVFAGVDDDDLATLYRSASFFVYPSLYEGFGIPLLEAMACGCPVVASRIPSSVEVSGGAAVFFDPRDEDEMIAAMEQAFRAGRGSALVAEGRRRAREFSWDRCARMTLDVYRELAR
jgi:alpha-1,3-rhamnosyl/mannosyltransferase